MNTLQKIGLLLFTIGLIVWIVTLSIGKFTLTDQILKDNLKPEHYDVIRPKAGAMLGVVGMNAASG